MAKTQEELVKLKEEFESLSKKAKELSNEELKEVTGGEYYDIEYHKNINDVSFLFDIGDIVQVYSGWIFGTVACEIIDIRKNWFQTHNTGGAGIYIANEAGYRDEYKVRELEGHWYFYLNEEWISRNDIQK